MRNLKFMKSLVSERGTGLVKECREPIGHNRGVSERIKLCSL